MSSQEDKDSPVRPRARYKLRSTRSSSFLSSSASGSLSSSHSPKGKGRHVSPLHRRSSSEDSKSSSPRTPRGRIVSSAVEDILELKNLYCCDIPKDSMDKGVLREHFSQFGQVTRLYLSLKKSSCTVHFKEHEAAKLAKLKGTELKGHTLHIFWSKPATKSPKGNETEVKDTAQTSKKIESDAKLEESSSSQKSPEKRSQLPVSRYSTSATAPVTRRSTTDIVSKRAPKFKEPKQVKEKVLYLPRSKYGFGLPQEVSDELESMEQSTDYETFGTTLESGMESQPGTVSIVKSSTPIRMPTSPLAMLLGKKKAYVSGTTRVRTKSPKAKLMELWQSKVKLEFHLPEDRYQILELRDRILRLRKGSHSNLSTTKLTEGTCQDMCPEKERYQRESRQQIAVYEHAVSANKELIMDHALAVKEYARSSADQEEPLPHELRPTPVLRMTMDYLLAKIVDRCDDKDENLGDWYHFLWDRTRGIRKDITQQELCDMDAVNLVEECVRFHIHCSGRLVAEKSNVFDNKINSENLTKCLQTLKYMYHDMALRGVTCENEAEFRGYVILLNLNDSNFLSELKELRQDIVKSAPVQFAIKASIALNSTNYIKFFNLVKETTYLNACVLLRYFYQIRSISLNIILRSFSPGNMQPAVSLVDFTRFLAFENMTEAIEFCNHHGLSLKDDKTEIIYRDKLRLPSHQLQMTRAVKLIESKRLSSVGETIKGGPLTTNSFESYRPQSSFNPNGTLKKEVMDIFHKPSEVIEETVPEQSSIIAQERQSPTLEEKPLKQEPITNVFLKAVKEVPKQKSPEEEERERQNEIEKERLRLEAKAIEEAEMKKCEELLNEMVYEIIHEEFGVFCERLDNVAILDLDEILLDVMCNMTRVAFKDVVTEEEEQNRIREEEERKCREEEERKRREEEEKKRIFIEETSQKITQEILEEIEMNMLLGIVNYEVNLHNIALEEMRELVEEIVCEDSKSMLEEDILKSKLDYLAERRRLYCCKKYLNLWRKTIVRLKEKQRSMEDFPAWFSPMSVKQQVSVLATPPPGTGTKMQPLVIPRIDEELMEDLKFFDFVANHLIIKSKNNIQSKYYKLVMSLPDEEESPAFSERLQSFTDIAFPETKDLKMKTPPTLLERKAVMSSTLTVSMRQLIGLHMLERGVPNEEAVCGMNGLIFVISHDTKCMEIPRNRLHKLITLRKHYGDIALAVLISKEAQETVLEQELHINSLSQETGVKINVKFFMCKKGPVGLSNMFLRAVDWLASVHESVITPYCTSAYFLMYSGIRLHLWDRFILAEAMQSDNCDKIKLSLFMAMKIHNRACREMYNLLTDNDVMSCTIGAPEFSAFLPVHELNSAGYRVMPPYFGSPEYKEMLKKLFRGALFMMPSFQTLRNKQDLDQLLMKLCERNQISKKAYEEICLYVEFCTRQLNPTSEEWIIDALKEFSWIAIMKYMMNDRMTTLNFMDTLREENDECPILVAANRQKLNEFISEQWYIFVREGDQAMSNENLSLWCQFGLGKYHQRADSIESGQCSGVKRKRTSDTGFPPAKRFKEADKDRVSILNSRGIIERYMHCKKEIESLDTMIDNCTKAQKNLDDMLKKYIESEESESYE